MEKELKNLDENIEKVPSPKVRFEVPTVENEKNIIANFCLKNNPSLDFSSMVYKRHPKLKKMVEGITDEKQFREQSDKYVEDYIEENKEIIEKAKEDFQKSWEEVNDKFLTNLSKDFETDLPDEIKEIKANVSINPMCPRWLDKWTFNLFYQFSDTRMKKVSIHEIIHFLYFKKWAEVFPDADKKNFNGMHSEWFLSEILVHTITNNNKIIQDIIKNEKSEVYLKWQDIEVDGKKLPELFEVAYNEHEEGKISFADFLKKSWGRYNENKDIIEGEIKK
ncbi:MAG: hypothetical protein ABIF22_03000 [bacterium]